MAFVVEIVADPIVRTRSAIADIAPPVWDSSDQAPDLCSERMVLPVPSLIKPQDRPTRLCRRQLVQHREDRCRTDPSAEQHDGAAFVPQCEAATWQGDVQAVADPERSQTGSCRAVRFELHADAIALVGCRTRKRVTAK